MNVWTTLGLKPTEDVAEIRRAYARKLKSIDVEADPGAFIELRRALEWALANAASRAPEPVWQPDEFEEAIDTPVFADMPSAPVTISPVESEGETSSADQEERNARFVRLEALLFSHDESAPDPDSLAAAVREIVDHPEMEHIEHDRSVQHWLAELLHAAVPRSDPVLAMVVDRFGWEQASGQIDQPWLFDALAERVRAFELAERVADPAHPFHKAWVELTRPNERLGFQPIGRSSEVHGLLRYIREHCPHAEEMLSGHRVALWDEKLSRTGPWRPVQTIIFGLWVLWVVSKLVTALVPAGTPSSQAASPVVAPTGLSASAGWDLGYMLDPILGDRGLDQLERRHPALRLTLVRRWEDARLAGESRSTLQTAVQELVDEAIAAGLRGGSPSLQAEYWRLHADRLKWLRDNAPAGDETACDRFARGLPNAFSFPRQIHERERDLMKRALLEPPSRDVNRRLEGRFSIPGPVAGSALARSGLPDATFTAALLDGGTPAERCTARLALIETALELPWRQREAFLREMSQAL